MPEWFDIAKDDRGTISLKVPPSAESYVAEQMRRIDYQGVTVYTALLVLQARLAALEAICLTASIPTAKVKGDRTQPTTIRRLGRADRLPFGWRLHPQNNKKLVPDREEQETIRRAQFLRAAGLSLREICRRLDQEGRGRRGKKWEGSHSVLGTILRREGRVPNPG